MASPLPWCKVFPEGMSSLSQHHPVGITPIAVTGFWRQYQKLFATHIELGFSECFFQEEWIQTWLDHSGKCRSRERDSCRSRFYPNVTWHNEKGKPLLFGFPTCTLVTGVAYGMMHVILEVLRSCILQGPMRHIGHLGKTAACPKHWTIHANHLPITPKLTWPCDAVFGQTPPTLFPEGPTDSP